MKHKALPKVSPKVKLNLNWMGIVICGLGALLYYYEYYLRVTPGVMRTELNQAYGLNEAGFGFLVGLYYWAYVPLQLLVGIFMDLLGPRITLTFAGLISGIGSYLFGISSYLMVAQLGRFLVGFGAAFAYVGVLKLSNIWLPKKIFAFMAGFCSTLGMLGGITGHIIVTQGVSKLGWRDTVSLSGLAGIILSLVLWLILRDHPTNPRTKKLDFIDLSLSQRLLILKQDLQAVIKLPDLWISGMIGCLTFAGLSVFADVWAFSFFNVLGLSKESIMVSSSMIYIGFGVGAPLWGIISDLINNRKIILALGSLVAALIITILIYVKLSLFYLNLGLFLFGFFLGVEVVVFAAINDLCPKEISATAMGFVNMLIMLSGSYLQPKIGLILDYFNNLTELNKFKLALTVLPLGFIIAGLLSLRLGANQKNRKLN